MTSVTIPESVTSIDDNAFLHVNNIIYNGSLSGSPWGAKCINGYIEDGLVYRNSSKKELLGCWSSRVGGVSIPSSVKKIGDYAFHNCRSLTSITIPEGVTNIGSGAFDDCSRLTGITIPEGVTSIGSDAFSDCSSLTSITIPKGVTCIEDLTFSNCSSLTSITIPEGVTSINDNAFSGCSRLTGITIPKGVTSIGWHAFSGCSSLTSITIPKGVTSIGWYTFSGCSSLTSITIPEGVTNIGIGAFLYCSKLKDVYYLGSKEAWGKISIGDNYHLLNAIIHYNNEKTYTVEYNKTQNGGIGQTETRNLDKGEKVDLTLTAAKSGWDFIGWNTDPNAKTGLTSLSVENNNIVLYAIYKKDLTATFIDYSGTAKKTRTVSTTIYNNSTSGKINAPAQNSYTGWTKRGWAASTSPDANVTGTFSISSDTTYYGLYQKTLKLSYNANGGSNVPSSQSGTQYTNSYSISTYKNPTFTLANAISKQGSTFTGWALGSIDGKIYGAGSKITINSNSTMYAAWKNTENI